MTNNNYNNNNYNNNKVNSLPKCPSLPGQSGGRESNIIGAIISYTTIEEVIHPSTGYYQITPFVLYRLNAMLHYYFSLSFLESVKSLFFFFYLIFFSSTKNVLIKPRRVQWGPVAWRLVDSWRWKAERIWIKNNRKVDKYPRRVWTAGFNMHLKCLAEQFWLEADWSPPFQALAFFLFFFLNTNN